MHSEILNKLLEKFDHFERDKHHHDLDDRFEYRYEYDKAGRLIEVENHRRSARLVNGVIINQYAYNPEGKLIAELDKDGNLIKTFIYASKSHVPDYFVDNTNTKYKIVTDQLGSVRLVINSQTGEVKEKMNHDEFGKVLQDTNPNYIPFGFAGGIYDSETKLVRFGVRDYDSRIGRWTSKDPIRFNGGDTNLYGYVIQDPVNLIDPSGLLFENILAGYLSPAQQTGLGSAVAATGAFLGRMSLALLATPEPTGTTKLGAAVSGILGVWLIYEGGLNAHKGGQRLYDSIKFPNPSITSIMKHNNNNYFVETNITVCK